jgi:hypothetical protein
LIFTRDVFRRGDSAIAGRVVSSTKPASAKPAGTYFFRVFNEREETGVKVAKENLRGGIYITHTAIGKIKCGLPMAICLSQL